MKCDTVPFDSKREALLYASSIERKPKRKGGDLSVKFKAYRCEDCSQWHLTKRVRR